MKARLSTVRHAFAAGIVLLGFGLLSLSHVLRPSAPPTPEDWKAQAFSFQGDGQRVLHLSGDPYGMGLLRAKHWGGLLAQYEHAVLDQLFEIAKTPFSALVLDQATRVLLLGLENHLSDTEKLELHGLATGSSHSFRDLGNRYERLMAYQALDDILQRHKIVRMRSSTLALSSKRGAQGHALLARNFGFESAITSDETQLITVVRPSTGFGFVSIGWAGLLGVVSGMNEHGLTITVNAGVSEETRRIGTPTAYFVRRALEQSRTIAEAISILRAARTFSTEIISVIDATGQIAVAEITPAQFVLRKGDLLASTNHLEHPAFANDTVNQRQKERTSTAQRRNRLESIIRAFPQSIGAKELLAALRDRQDSQGTSLAPGHRHAIDAMRTTHSAIFDATGRRVWIGRGPHALGSYNGYDVRKLIYATTPEEVAKSRISDLQADPLVSLASTMERARFLWPKIQALLDASNSQQARKVLSKTRSMADHPTTLFLRAQLAEIEGELFWAQRYYRQALESPPEFPREAVRIKEALHALGL